MLSTQVLGYLEGISVSWIEPSVEYTSFRELLAFSNPQPLSVVRGRLKGEGVGTAQSSPHRE